jgi:hypothetical protein
LITDIEIEEFLEHHGVKGQRWGVRGTRRVQKRLDRAQRLATGKGSVKDQLLRSAFTKKGLNRQLQRGADHQAKVNAGKRRIRNRLDIMAGVRVKDLNFHKKGDAKAKMDGGQKAALGFVAAMGTIQVLSLASRVAKA